MCMGLRGSVIFKVEETWVNLEWPRGGGSVKSNAGERKN